MSVIDIIIILIITFGIYFGYQSGFIKRLNDLVVLFIASFFAGKISDILFGLLYKYFPFFNFSGKAEGLKSINIIFWKLILYIAIIILIMTLIKKIYIKLKIEDKISDSIIEANLISKILGAIITVPLMIIFLFDILLFLLTPNFNLTGVKNSKLASIIIEKTPILSNQNNNLYKNQKYIIERINQDDNTLENYKVVNNDIINNIIKTNLVSEDKIKFLEKKNKLVGVRKEKINNKTNENSDNNDGSDNDKVSPGGSDSHDDLEDSKKVEDSKDYDYSEDFDESEIYEETEDFEESEIYEETEDSDGSEDVEVIEEEESDNYCDDFPGDC